MTCLPLRCKENKTIVCLFIYHLIENESKQLNVPEILLLPCNECHVFYLLVIKSIVN